MSVAAPLPFQLNEDGWLLEGKGVTRLPSPNYNERPMGAQIDSLVVHCMSLPERSRDPSHCLDLFANNLDFDAHPSFSELRGLKVSSHFLIDRKGGIYQFVSCKNRAWHAGVSACMGRSGFNDFSIGIELQGDVYSPYAYPQLAVLNALVAELKRSYPLKYGFSHSEIAPARKTDPGPFFDWGFLRKPTTYELL